MQKSSVSKVNGFSFLSLDSLLSAHIFYWHHQSSKMVERKLKIAVACSSNMNRSMEAHSVLSKKGYCVQSFGTGDKVKLPGTAIDKPNVYDFSCTYDEIYNDLARKDKTFYTQNGLLHILDRNRRIKPKPEKFQLCNEQFDLIITCEERVYDQVIDYFHSKSPEDNTPVHIINVDIQDNQEEATIGAFFIRELVHLVSKCEDLDNDLVRLLPGYEKKCNRSLLHCMLFY